MAASPSADLSYVAIARDEFLEYLLTDQGIDDENAGLLEEAQQYFFIFYFRNLYFL